VGVDLGGGYIDVTQKLLDSPDIITIFQQMGGEAVAENMRSNVFLDTSSFGG